GGDAQLLQVLRVHRQGGDDRLVLGVVLADVDLLALLAGAAGDQDEPPSHRAASRGNSFYELRRRRRRNRRTNLPAGDPALLAINSVAIEDTFAEAFPMTAARVLVTAATPGWARTAGL